jgi:hypothetical protein
MNLNSITSKDISKIAKLLKKKEALLERVAKVDAQLSAFEGGTAVVVVKKRGMSAAGRKAIAAAQKKRWAKLKGKKTAGTRKASPVTEKLMAAMNAAGAKGISVPDLAQKTGLKAVNVRAWIQVTAPKLGVKKISRGVYAV